jgi:hypothetical protein
VGAYAPIAVKLLTSEPKFSSLSVMLMMHETQSIAKQNDINSLISQFVRDGMINAELAKNLRERAAEDYPIYKSCSLKY